MKFHDTLNEKLFNIDTMEMLPEVREKLLEIADSFIEFLEIPTDAVLDKVITGSSASYNYNKYSDLDLHIIVDYEKVHEDCPLVNGYLNALKKQFNDNHDIFIHGVPVELYAEQKDQGTVHNGLYSLNTGWIDKPQKIAPTDNDAAVEAKFNEIKELVDKCEDSEEAQELIDKIYNMRKAGLAEAGEFCTENLAFKKLRNEGCMEKLRKIKKEQIDKQLSLESYNEDYIDDLKFMLRGVTENSDQGIKQTIINKLNELPVGAKLVFESIKGQSFIRYEEEKITDTEWMSKCVDIGEVPEQTIIKTKVNSDIVLKHLLENTNDGHAYDSLNKVNESIKEGLEEKEYQGCKYTILPDGKYCSIRIYAPKGYSFKNGDTWYSTETELKNADKIAKDIIDNEIELKESIKESEDELTLEDKLINILTKDGWNHLNGRGGESLEKDNITISLYVDSVIFNEFEDDEKELPLNTEEDLQNIIQIANELSNKNESIKESEELKVGDIAKWNNVVWVRINSIDGNEATVSPIHKEDIDSGKFEKEEIVLLNSLRKSNESMKEEVLPHNINKVNQLIDKINKNGYFKIDGEDISVNKGFGTVGEQIDLQSLAKQFEELGFKVRETHFQITVYGLKDFMEKQDNKNEFINKLEETLRKAEGMKKDIKEEQEKISLQDINNWFESKTLLGKQDDPEFYIRSAVRKWPQLKGHEKELRDNLEKEKAKNHPWYPYMAMVANTLGELGLFEPNKNESIEEDKFKHLDRYLKSLPVNKTKYIGVDLKDKEGNIKKGLITISYEEPKRDNPTIFYNFHVDCIKNDICQDKAYASLIIDTIKGTIEKYAKRHGLEIIKTTSYSSENESIEEISVDEDVDTLEKKMDDVDTTLKDLMDKINGMSEEVEDTEFDIDKANKLIDEALKED